MIDNHKIYKKFSLKYNNYLYRIMKNLVLIIFLFNSNYLFSQSGELLIQQYNKGPSLDNYYSKLEIFLGGNLFLMNKNEKTKPIINFGGNLEVEFNISKTFGIKTGLYHFPVKYFYINNENLRDLIEYNTIPLGIKLVPTKKSKFSMGINYNIINKATFYDENLKGEYNINEYKNNMGFFISYEYLIWKIISLNIKYKFSKVNNIDKEIKQEKYKGFMLSLKLKIFKTKIINK